MGHCALKRYTGQCYNARLEGDCMHRLVIAVAMVVSACASVVAQAKLSVHWEELTAADFVSAIHQSQGTCLLPFGILEKHGPHLPMGTDLLDVRHATLAAAEKE